MGFPQLMAEVNNALAEELHFENEFLSIQKVRNCLEHRDGVVGDSDVDKETGRLLLSFPRLMMFVEKDGEIVEIGVGSSVEAGQSIGVKMATGTREFEHGTRIAFSEDDLSAIGWGCWAFASELQRKLPSLE